MQSCSCGTWHIKESLHDKRRRARLDRCRHILMTIDLRAACGEKQPSGFDAAAVVGNAV